MLFDLLPYLLIFLVTFVYGHEIHLLWDLVEFLVDHPGATIPDFYNSRKKRSEK